MEIKKLRDQIILSVTDRSDAEKIILETIDAIIERQDLIIQALGVIGNPNLVDHVAESEITEILKALRS